MSCRGLAGVRRRLTYWLFAAVLSTLVSATRGGEPDMYIGLSDEHSCIEVVGVPTQVLEALRDAKLPTKEWGHVLRVTVMGHQSDDVAAAPPMMGRYDVDENVVTFTPRFPLRPGLRYRVVFDAATLGGKDLAALSPIDAEIELPRRPATAATEIDSVYPSSADLPANLLKFYIHFSAPMSRGDAYRYVRILDAEGRPVPDAFLELPEELWDASGQRLTILFDPGRIKRGLKPNEDVGAPLIAGKTYCLVISPGWPDANGEPLAKESRKEFLVVEADDEQPEPAAWRVSPPAVASRDPLTVVVNEPLDHALLERSLKVVDAAGRVVDGEVSIEDEETCWRFRPNTDWQVGAYRIVIDSRLEDRAGNSIGRAFETQDSTAPVGAAVEEPAVIPFVVAP